MKAADWSALAAWATLVVLLIAAGVAIWQVLETRRLRKEQTRPFVVAYFWVEGWRGLIHFAIHNLGQTIARNVRLDFDKEPEQAQAIGTPFKEISLVRSGIGTLVPDQKIESFFDDLSERREAELPMQYMVTVQYDDFDGKSWKETFPLDLDIFIGLVHVQRRSLHDIGESLNKIEQWFGRWTRDHKGLRVFTSDERSHARRQMRGYRRLEALERLPEGSLRRRMRVRIRKLRRALRDLV